MTRSLTAFAREKLKELEKKSLRRKLVVTDRKAGAMAARTQEDGLGRELISFCCNDYLNFNHHPEVIAASAKAVQTYGAGSGASRLVTGNHPLMEQLEQRLAAFKGAEAAVVFGSGYLTNAGVVPVLTGPNDLILVDELAHSCLHAGSQLAGSTTRVFRHNDVEHVQGILEAERTAADHCLILTDGVFSMDGDLAPIPGLARLAKQFDCWLMTDDAHGIGVMGGGHGSTFVWGNEFGPGNVPLQMGTLSKAIGSAGGYLCASNEVVDLIKTRARTLIYSTGLSPASAAAALMALDLIEREPDYCLQPVRNATTFTKALGLPDPQSPIVPIVLGDADRTLEASRFLESEGFLVTGIRPPTVPVGTSRLRITFTAEHRREDIERLANLVKKQVLQGSLVS
jgi:8-amino-7-oxononanoate synthase